MTVILAAVLNSFWPALAVAAAAWALLRFTPGVAAGARHATWWAVLAVVVLLPLALQRSKPPGQLPVPLPAFPVAPSTAGESIGAGPAAPLHQPVAPVLPLEFRTGAWTSWILAAWTIFVLLQLTRLASSFLYVRGVKRRASPPGPALRGNFDAWLQACCVQRPVRLLVSAEVVSPMAAGFRRPAVILPGPLTEELRGPELDHVLLHEVAHLARHDDWTNLAARAVAAAFGWHPIAAWVLRRVDREREIACDDWVVSVTGEARPYAASLARLFELCWARRRILLAAGMADRASLLGERIEMLLHRRCESAPRASAARVALIAAVLLALLMAGVHTPRWIALAQDPPPAPAAEPAGPARAPRAARAPQSVPAAEAPQPPAPATAVRTNGSFLAALVAAGYGNLAVDDIIALKDHGISAAFLSGVSQSGWGKLAPSELIDLCSHGVPPDYLAQMRKAGFQNLTVREVIDLRMQGVRAEYPQQIHALGFGPYPVRQIIQFAQQGVRVDLFSALKDAGFLHADSGDIIYAQQNGLRDGNLREARQYGPNLTLKQIIRLKQAGVI